MTLEQHEKDDLKSLTEHRGFKILEKIVEQMEKDLFTPFKKQNIRDESVQDDLVNTQMMLAWAEYLIDTAKSKTKSIAKKEVK